MIDINKIIVNDGWLAFEQGRPSSDCPYVDDPTARSRWEHGFKAAEHYYNVEQKGNKWKKVSKNEYS